MTTAHSPLPWKNGFLVTGSAIWSDEDKHVVSLSDAVPTEREKADAALIVRAVNAHDALLEALEACQEYLVERACEPLDQMMYGSVEVHLGLNNQGTQALEKAKGALALASGTTEEKK